LQEEVLDKRKRISGEITLTRSRFNNLALTYLNEGHLTEAEKLQEEVGSAGEEETDIRTESS
jgi:hypothetical protein